jgi:hypothetical protein
MTRAYTDSSKPVPPARLAAWTTAHSTSRCIAALRADLLYVEPTCSRARCQGDNVDVIDDRNLISAKKPLAWRPRLRCPYASPEVPLLGLHENKINRLVPLSGYPSDLRARTCFGGCDHLRENRKQSQREKNTDHHLPQLRPQQFTCPRVARPIDRASDGRGSHVLDARWSSGRDHCQRANTPVSLTTVRAPDFLPQSRKNFGCLYTTNVGKDFLLARQAITRGHGDPGPGARTGGSA